MLDDYDIDWIRHYSVHIGKRLAIPNGFLAAVLGVTSNRISAVRNGTGRRKSSERSKFSAKQVRR